MYLKCKTKSIFGTACLEKSSYFNRKYRLIRLFFRIIFSKNSEILSDKELFKVNQIDIPDYQYYLGCNAKEWSA